MEKVKYILAILANYIPVLWAYIFYSIGAGTDWSLFIISQILLVTLNHKITKSKLALLFLHVNLLVSTIVANWLSTHLYYTNISSDDETLLVGNLGLKVGVIFVILMSTFSLLIRIFLEKQKGTVE